MAWQSIDRRSSEESAKATVLDDSMKQAIRQEIGRYPNRRAALLPALHMVQDENGCISEAAMIELAELLEISPAEVLDTAGFYDMYSSKRWGRHLIMVCRSLSCELCGCGEVFNEIQKKLAIEPGQTTMDGKFTLIAMECLGACEFAPVMLIDGKLHKDVTPEKVEQILNEVGE